MTLTVKQSTFQFLISNYYFFNFDNKLSLENISNSYLRLHICLNNAQNSDNISYI